MRKKHYNIGKDHPNYKDGRTLKKHYCQDCGKRIVKYNARFCKSCKQKGKRHFNWKGGLPYCKICKKKLGDWDSEYCHSCSNKNLHKIGILNSKGKNNSMYEIHRLGKNVPSYGIKGMNKNKIVKHHINLNKKNNRKNNLLYLSLSKHTSLHQQAYSYLVKKYLIKKYIRWFFNYYKGNRK